MRSLLAARSGVWTRRQLVVASSAVVADVPLGLTRLRKAQHHQFRDVIPAPERGADQAGAKRGAAGEGRQLLIE